MKYKLLILISYLTLFFYNFSIAQNNSITIENIDKEVVWSAVYKTFQELKYPRPTITTQQGTGETSYYNYKSLLIKNRLRFKFNLQDNKLIISIFGRQYFTKSGWGDNPLPMSKKQVAKILIPIKERLTELSKNKNIASNNNKTQTNKEANNFKKAGIYEDIVIVKTGDQKIDLLAAHKNGTIIGYDLSEDKKTVKSLVYKEKKDSEVITMFFDEQGYPKGMVTDHIIVNIASVEGNLAELTVLDLQGNTIGKNKIELPINRQTSIKFQEGENRHGPSSPNIFILDNEDSLSTYIGYSSTLTKAVSCGAGVAAGIAAETVTAGAATPLVIVGVIAACESIYFDLVARYVGEDHFLFEELNLASEVSSIVSAVNPLDTKKWVNILSSSSDITSILKNSVESGIRLFNKYGTKSNTQITETNKETDKLDIEGEFIRISALDPAIGIAFTKHKPATIERGREIGKIGSEVFNEEVMDALMDENYVVSERVLLDKVLGELNLGSSELADPDQKLKQGRIVLAGFYIINKYTCNKEKATVNLRVIYTETGEVAYTNTIYYNNMSKYEKEVDDDIEKEASKIITAIEKFAKERVLIIKENPKRYTNSKIF